MKAAVTKKKGKRVSYIPLILMMTPGLIYLFINNYLPMFGITIAFKKIDFQKGILRSDWCGFQNFEYLFKTKDAFIMIRNTLCYNIVFIFVGLVLSLAIAVMMTEISKLKIAKFITTMKQSAISSSLFSTSFLSFLKFFQRLSASRTSPISDTSC